MEIKVDVHTVHPISPEKKNDRSSKGPHESWGTPDTTPIRNVIKRTPSKPELFNELRSNIKDLEQNRRSLFPTQQLRLFNNSPKKVAIQECITELEEIQSPQTECDKSLCEVPNRALQVIETPQSPVPSSPSREKKCKGLRLPALLDPFVPIDPQGRAYISWLLLVTFCYSYNAWCVALRATFPYQTLENTPIWMMVDYLCDAVYMLDLVLVKPRLMFLNEGFWVDDPVETRKNYRKKLQYKFDVISLLPLDILYIYYGPQKVILRLPRVLKLQTFWEFHQAMDRVLSSPYIVRIGKTLFYIFYLIHLNACAYYAMSDYIGLASNGWVYDNKGNAYIRCFYFATKTATSIGKNPKPENTMEFLYMTAAWLMGVFVFALLIGQIRDIIATATRARSEYRKTVDGCTRYLRRLNMPLPLQRRVTCWFTYTWNQQRCFDEPSILNSLPYNMKRDVALEVHINILSKVQLFRDCSSSLLRDLVLQLRPVSCLPGDVLVRRGDVGHHMYIVKCGECYVMSPGENEVLATLRAGSVFGEISLLGIDGLRRRTATVRSRGYSSLFALSRSDLDAALKYHKEAAQILRIRADQIIRENAARLADKRLEQRMEAKRNEEGRRRSLASGGGSGGGKGRSGRARRRLSAVSETKVGTHGGYRATRADRGRCVTMSEHQQTRAARGLGDDV
ncbi:hypothetical protein KGM_201296 [Danaus plexippus plexippus]|uniref:Uncharacterized protein n=1 Tax=Danaus plexippus plexippus TaxID=278856 RepID=A0A212F8A3_DANPL|nr:cyclic nucleotide-gated cation channel beta-1-like isoform X2 [Danaus plexippus plexippus]OWR49939.1 hypothetical protein KGM_201296 [Danaus plexippus plexippus]